MNSLLFYELIDMCAVSAHKNVNLRVFHIPSYFVAGILFISLSLLIKNVVTKR